MMKGLFGLSTSADVTRQLAEPPTIDMVLWQDETARGSGSFGRLVVLEPSGGQAVVLARVIGLLSSEVHVPDMS